MCYILVTTTKPHEGALCYGYYNTGYEVPSYRLLNTPKNLVSQKLPLNIKQTGSIFIAGNAGMTAPLNFFVTVPQTPPPSQPAYPEDKLINDLRRRNRDTASLVSFSLSKTQCGADPRSIPGLYRFLCAGRA